MKLLAHNQKAYEAVMSHFKNHNKACINHATGTGKSYIAAAVAKHFKNILVIAPNIEVLEETKKLFKGTFITYSILLTQQPQEQFDLIILDEFHRAGASKWGEALKDFLNSQNNYKLLGLTATPIRFLDGAKNMNDELFEGNVVSELSLIEAINKGILPSFTLVNSLYKFNKEDYPNIPDEEFEKLKTNFEASKGVDKILKEYLPKESKKIIVFGNIINNLKYLQEYIQEWFNKAGFNDIKFYPIHTKNDKARQDLKNFNEDTFEGIKIALTVNMLNEGVHIQNVNSVIMLRGTISPIIYLQQIGRCISVDSKQPVVLDLVNNSSHLNFFRDYIYNTKNNVNMYNLKEHENVLQNAIKIIGYCQDIQTILTSFKFHSKDYWTYEKCYEEAKKYHSRSELQKNNRSAYRIALSKDWLNTYDWFEKSKKKNKWNKKTCYEEAKKYKTRGEFAKSSASAYRKALHNGWVNTYDWFEERKKRDYWNEETCLEEAKKYHSRKEFHKGNGRAYEVALKNGWIDTYDWFVLLIKPKGYWDKETCRKEALKYNTRGKFQIGSNVAYAIALRNNWIDEFFPKNKK